MKELQNVTPADVFRTLDVMAEILDGFLANYLFAEANATVNFSRNSTRPRPPLPCTPHTHPLLPPPSPAGCSLCCSCV